LEINLNNPKGASFKENHLMTTARDVYFQIPYIGK